jgi:hypothetical protein
MEKFLRSVLTGYLPKGKGTYIAIAIGLLVIWGSWGAVKFGIVGESAADALAAQGCTVSAGTIEDVDAKAAVLEVCQAFVAKPINTMVAILFTIGLLVAAFMRRAITDLLNKVEAMLAASKPPATGPPQSGG